MLLSPGFWLALCCGLGVLLQVAGRRRAGVSLGVLGVAGFAVIAALPIDQWLLAPLENRFPPLSPAIKIERVIVLGGAIDAALSADRDSPSLNGAAARITAMIALARAYPEARVVFTGGPMPNRPDGPSEAAPVRALANTLGIADGRILYEDRSLTTWQNATLTRDVLHPASGEEWVLVTSAAHMPRSVGAFRAAGFKVVADPVSYKSFASADHRGSRGFGERLALIDTAAHEWLGLAYYRLMGRSSAWFPAP